MNNKEKSSIIYQNVTYNDVILFGRQHNMSFLKGFTPKEIALYLYEEDFKSQDKWKALGMLDHTLYNKKRAKAYKEAFHKKYDELILWFNKRLPNAKFKAAFNTGIKACIKAKSDLPYYKEFYTEYFTKYNVDSIIDYAYTLSEKEKDMCKTLLIASIQLYRDTHEYKIKESNDGGKVMTLSDVYIDIRYQNEIWCDDNKVINYLIESYHDQIANTTLPLKGNIAPVGKLRNLQKTFKNYDAKIDKIRFKRLVGKAIKKLKTPHNAFKKDANTKTAQSFQRLVDGSNTSCINIKKENIPEKDISLTSEQIIDNKNQTTNNPELEALVGLKATENIESSPKEVYLNIIQRTNEEIQSSAQNRNIRLKNGFEYSEHEIINQEIGDKGETLVLENEIRKAKAWNLPFSMLKKIRRVSLESDDYGYDILSFDKDGNEHYIEVKTTKASYKKLSFIFTRNELEHAKKYGKSYSIVMVFDILQNPRIWNMGNPFVEEPIKVQIEPIKYLVSVCTELKK